MDALPELWNVDHLAEYLDATKSFVYRLTREHRIRYIKFGKELRFRPDDVAAHLEAESVPISGPVAAPAAPWPAAQPGPSGVVSPRRELPLGVRRHVWPSGTVTFEASRHDAAGRRRVWSP